MAKELIRENRQTSIASLQKLLRRIYLAKAEDEIQKAETGLQPAKDEFFDRAFADLRALFEAYGEERGPLLAELNIQADGNLTLAEQPVPPNSTPLVQYHVRRSNELRVQLREIEERYQTQAQALFTEAQRRIDEEITRLQLAASKARIEAEDKALADAKAQATINSAPIEVEVQQLIPPTLPAIPAHQVTVPGTNKLPDPPVHKGKQIFGSLTSQRHVLDEQIDIWTKTSGLIRSKNPNGAIDVTEEFLRWRNEHKAGL
jgi:hypothetical protein